MRALIVDDAPDMLGLLTAVATELDLRFDTAGNAEEAWEKFQTAEYGLVLLDWLLPGMDGLELCRERTAEAESTLRRLGHQIAGTAFSFGFGPMGEVAAHLEHDPVEELAERARELIEPLRRVVPDEAPSQEE